MNIRIRKAGIEDWPVIVKYNAAMALETEGKHLDSRILTNGVQAALKSREKGQYFLAAAKEKIVGQLMLTREWSDWRNGFFWWIQSVYVHPEWRKQGIFRALYEYVLKEAQKQPDVCGLRLYVEKANLSAQKTYERMGMQKTDYAFYEVEF